MRHATEHILLACALLAPLAHAHVSLEQPTAQAGTFHKLTFRVTHGCQGSPTKAFKVVLPESVIEGKPMPKAGWNVSTVVAALTTPALVHGKPVTSAVREVSWAGGPLQDAHYDEFSIQVKLPDSAGKLYFKATQLCDEGRLDWNETPQDGAARKAPAPVLDVIPASDHEHHH